MSSVDRFFGRSDASPLLSRGCRSTASTSLDIAVTNSTLPPDGARCASCRPRILRVLSNCSGPSAAGCLPHDGGVSMSGYHLY